MSKKEPLIMGQLHKDQRVLNSIALADIIIRRNNSAFLSSVDKNHSNEEKTAVLMKKLMESDIDPVLFDSLLSSNADRKLKARFGIAFLVLTIIFTITSYAIVILNSICKWGISEVAITSLVIETPIQFIGLLYIIARNLFPQKHIVSSVNASEK